MNKFSFRQRQEYVNELKEREFDVLIVGGGINGAGVLRDLCLRRSTRTKRRVALIEKSHFATSASSKNSQLIHGGLRYLKHLDFGLVREALSERSILLRIAPHATWNQSFLLPVYEFGKRWYYQAGVVLYDWLSGFGEEEQCRWLNSKDTLHEEPYLNPVGLRGAMQFWDGRMHASRLVLDQLREAVEMGAITANFVEAQEPFRQTGQVVGVQAQDRLSGEKFIIRAKVIVNTVGPWEKTKSLQLLRGSHLIFPKLTQGRHALAFFEDQGRILFVIPYGIDKRFSLVGTTERMQKKPEPVSMGQDEQDYLNKHIRDILPHQSLEPLGHYSALRPLISNSSNFSPSAISRRHKIWTSAPNVYHVGGGKWTTFRLISEEVVDRIARDHCPNLGPSRSAEVAIDGNTQAALNELTSKLPELGQKHRLSYRTVTLIMENYGIRTPEILSLCQDTRSQFPLTSSDNEKLPYIFAQAQWAVENEMTGRLEDFLKISTPVGYLYNLSPETEQKLQGYFKS